MPRRKNRSRPVCLSVRRPGGGTMIRLPPGEVNVIRRNSDAEKPGSNPALSNRFCRRAGFDKVPVDNLGVRDGTMQKVITASLLLLTLATSVAQERLPAYPRVALETTEGTILLELDRRRAPLTVAHFLKLLDAGHYNGTIFHRVIPNFMAQAGGFNRDFDNRETEDTLVNESGNGLKNLRGTIAMARLPEPHTANAQFFINVADNRSLDPKPDRWGYAVFGTVIEGLPIVDKISQVRTGPGGDFAQDVPVVPIIIERAVRVKP